jgi:hypothetical protein
MLGRKGKYNPAEVRSADFRNAQYSDGASPCPHGGSHFNYGVFSTTSFSDHLRCPYSIYSLQGRDKLRLASKFSPPHFLPQLVCIGITRS